MEFVTDAKGRKLYLRQLNVMDQVKLLRAIGAAQANNQPYVQMVMMAAGVSQIGDIPCILPTNERQIDAVIERLGDDGFATLLVKMQTETKALQDAAEAAMQSAAVSGEAVQCPLEPSA